MQWHRCTKHVYSSLTGRLSHVGSKVAKGKSHFVCGNTCWRQSWRQAAEALHVARGSRQLSIKQLIGCLTRSRMSPILPETFASQLGFHGDKNLNRLCASLSSLSSSSIAQQFDISQISSRRRHNAPMPQLGTPGWQATTSELQAPHSRCTLPSSLWHGAVQYVSHVVRPVLRIVPGRHEKFDPQAPHSACTLPFSSSHGC
mmetsp:Transcript_28080/g.46659  ORF Transcript_28080/g.46659 Transcript_28080/m.46659 type:complete len:201 (+) Transcript_28080:923-1525(+)